MKARVSNPTLLEDTLNENFVKKHPNARKITASGTALFWQETILEKELDETSYQELNALNLDFPTNYEEDTEVTNAQKMSYRQ